MKITIRYCKPTLVSVLVSLIICTSTLMGIQADQYGQGGGGMMILEPTTVSEQRSAEVMEQMLRDSTLVNDSETRRALRDSRR